MAKLRLENEWKMWLAFGLLFVVIAAFLYLASRPPKEGDEYLWKVTKVGDVKKLGLKGSGNLMEVGLAGLIIPDSQRAEVQDFLTKNLESKWVRLKMLDSPSKDNKEALVFLAGEDITARIVRLGLAEIDRNEERYDIRPYIELEQEAKKEKRGLWKTAPHGAQ